MPQVSLDVIVQSSAVGLFHSCGLAVAPLPCNKPALGPIPHPELAAMIGFRGKGFTGMLTVGVPESVFVMVPQNPEHRFTGKDWVREVANQLLGRVKARLLQLGTTLVVDLPSLLTLERLERLRARSPFFAVYRFRTLRSEIVVTLTCDIDASIFVYTGAVPSAVEGDIILF